MVGEEWNLLYFHPTYFETEIQPMLWIIPTKVEDERIVNNMDRRMKNSRSRSGSSHSGQNHQDASAPESTMTCMSVFEEGSKIAFACYDEERNEIILESSHVNGDDIESSVQSFVTASQPTLVLIGAKVAGNDALRDLLTRCPPAAGNEANAERPMGISASHIDSNIPFRMLKSSAFDLKKCKTLILRKLRVLTLIHQSKNGRDSRGGAFQPLQHAQRIFPNSIPSHLPSRYHSLASMIDFDSHVLLRALGSLLSFLQSSIFRMEEGGTITINHIKHACSSQYMRIDRATLTSLHIFATEHHPLIAKGQGKDKEGFSLFTLLDRTKSRVGRQCLREWMLKPLLDPSAIKKRHDGIELFLKPELHAAVANVLTSLSNVGPIDKIILRMQKCHSSPNDFLILSQTISAALSIVNVLSIDFRDHLLKDITNLGGPETNVHVEDYLKDIDPQLGRYLHFLDKILQRCHVPVLKDLHERIISIVDQEATAETNDSVVIHFGFHEELDNAKETFDMLDGE
jgi:DNA mismatch repair ATPase MutS